MLLPSSRRAVVGDGPRVVLSFFKNGLMRCELDVIFCKVLLVSSSRRAVVGDGPRAVPCDPAGFTFTFTFTFTFCLSSVFVFGCHRGMVLAAIQQVLPLFLSCPSYNPVNPDSDCVCFSFLLSYHYQRKNA